MLLSKIKIKGFKSFADPVELDLERGITAVVGPNGCGKSNIADSVNWALGEQSPTSLRGKKMEQMIFNGSSSRKAMGMAEVTITLSTQQDLEASLDFDDDEVEGLERTGSSLAELLRGVNGDIAITRRMFRDSQSEYLINGKSCRLKDIQDLLMALGIGTRAITIVEQDRIAAIISSKPVDRRVIIEDAAGITKFKLNRHLTTLKLEHARNNLDRIRDLLGEQEVHVRSLRQQAARARRFQNLQEERRSVEARLIAMRHHEVLSRHRVMNEKIRELEERLAVASAELSRAESAEADLRQRIDETSERKVKKREEFYQNNLELDRNTNRLKHLRQSIDELFTRSNDVGSRLAAARERLTERESTLASAQEQALKLERQVQDSARQLSLLKERADVADADLHSLTSRRDEITGDLAELREQRAGETSKVDALQRDEQRLATAAANARALIEKNRAAVSEAGDRIAQLEQRGQTIVDRLAEIARELERIKANRTAFRQEMESVDRRLEQLKSDRGNAQATLTALEEMEQQREGIAEAAKAILQEQELAAQVRPLGIVADFIDIDPAYATAAVAAYGRMLEAVVVETEEHARRGIALLKERSIGRASFVPLDRCSDRKLDKTSKDDLRNWITGRDERGAGIRAIFPKALVADDVAEGLKLSAAHPDVKVATRDGIVARNGGVLRGGGESLGAKIFSRRERMEELKKEVADIGAELDCILARRTDLLERDQQLQQESATLGGEAEKLRLQQVELAGQRTAAEDEQERSAEAVAATEREIAQFESQRAAAREELKQLRSRIAEIEERISARIAELSELEDNLKEKSEEAGQARRKEHELRTDVSTIEERLKAAHSRRQSLEIEMQEDRRRIREAELEAEQIEEQRAASLAEIGQIEGGMDGKVEFGKALEVELHKLDGELDELTVQRKRHEADIRAHKSAVNRVREELDEARLKNREEATALEHLRERAREDLRLSPEEIEQIELDSEETDSETLMNQLTDIKEKIERMGNVNLLAEEEYEQQLSRFETLDAQRRDVEDSIDEMERIIDRIDRVSRTRFAEAFERINENFHDIFRILFQGGKAELILGEGDLLSAGIEIMVQPPGKRNQSAQLLSGGEKSLAAFALILAVMEYRPTPFCVLDESDAALDESNVRRIASLIRERSDQTQFILVTHNKTTMEVADRLYGVTMEEPGVSRLVSVQFN